jgi:radical SAM superfamily enzyme YgiQ (UPF0313 family)
MKVLLVIPPLLQFNCPYPSTGYLLKYLKDHHIDAQQVDWSLELIIKVFSKEGLERMHSDILKNKRSTSANKFFFKNFHQYKEVIDMVRDLLQGNYKNKIIQKINQRKFLPEGPRFEYIHNNHNILDYYFSNSKSPELDQAKFLASLFIDDISDVIQNSVDPFWGLAKYGEKLAASMTSFDMMLKRLKMNTLMDEFYLEIIKQDLRLIKPELVGFSVPFPGNVYGALRGAQEIKKISSQLLTVMGGGYVNTELKSLSDQRFFKMIDYLIFDDGEKPLELLVQYLTKAPLKQSPLLRTWYLDKMKNEIVKSSGNVNISDVSFKNLEGPSYKGLDISRYISMIEYPNAMMRYWTDYKWNKIIVAHGCYWKKCTFCDISLDYISRYEPSSAEKIVDQMQRISGETGMSGFHLVDEAAPPVVLKAMAEVMIKRKFQCEWWGNIRFDESFTLDVTKKLAKAGLTAVSGGLEVASERVLQLISKGVSIEQVARVTKNFRKANVLVHAYLMYGFPTQTEQETIDSLEVVRQLFLNGCLSSAYWHRFSATAHSPVGLNPKKYGIRIIPPKKPKNGIFAMNDLEYEELQNKTDHDVLGIGLKKALYNYQLGIGLKFPLQDWFEHQIPATKIGKNYIHQILKLK